MQGEIWKSKNVCCQVGIMMLSKKRRQFIIILVVVNNIDFIRIRMIRMKSIVPAVCCCVRFGELRHIENG